MKAERETCRVCHHEDDRRAFEGWVRPGGWLVSCPVCETPHEDQEDHDA